MGNGSLEAQGPGSLRIVVPKDLADAVKEGSSVTQSTVANQVLMVPNIAENEPSKVPDTQRDDAVPALSSSDRSPKADIQSPGGLGADAAAQSRSQALLPERDASPI